MKMIFYSQVNKTHFALSLVFKVRVFGTRKWPIRNIAKTKAIKVFSLRADATCCFSRDPNDDFIAPVVVIGQLTENHCTTTIEEIEYFPVAEKKNEQLSAWRSQNWKQRDALALIKKKY